MIGNRRNFSLSIWDHEDKFLCLLKAADSDFEGQSYNENFKEKINGEKTLSFSVPMYVYSLEKGEQYGQFTEKQNFIQNEAWRHIYNEQKIRYTEYDAESQQVTRIEEFVLKQYVESRNGEQKIADCTCESLAVYELGKVGWGINFDIDYITPYEQLSSSTNNLLTLDYWLKKIFYKETNLGRVSNTTECTYLLQGMQLRNSDGYPISRYSEVDKDGNQQLVEISEPKASAADVETYRNDGGWYWEIQAKDVRDPSSVETISTLYEEPIINMYTPIGHAYIAQSYQKLKGQPDSSMKLRPHPISEANYGYYVYVTNEKKRLFTIERSNIYNIIQELCSTFSVWAYFQYEYNEVGRIIGRKIVFKSEAINDDIAFDFSYGKNLISCQRSSDSNDLVTKLIVPDTESSINEGAILSIREATANPTGENYLYNFKYFLDNGMLTSGPTDPNSDEYKINFHNAWIKTANENISNLQKSLVPLYDRRDNLNADLTTQQASRIALMDNMQSIQDKIDAIPANQHIINSWQSLPSVQDHIGPVKTITTTTDNFGGERYYLKFDRDDVLYAGIIEKVKENNNNYYVIKIDDEIKDIISILPFNPDEIYHTDVMPHMDHLSFAEESTLKSILTSTYIPRVYTTTFVASASTKPIPENTTKDFILLNNSKYIDEVVYSEIGGTTTSFIKALYLKNPPINNASFVRVRFKYAPLIWYYYLLQDYREKLIEVENKIQELESYLKEINNKILIKELALSHLLNEKNKEILSFEKQYKPYIREGYWEANNYQGQIRTKTLNTSTENSNFNGYYEEKINLSKLNLNDSLNNYTKYISLTTHNAEQIDIDSIECISKHPDTTLEGGMLVPRYRGNDYEVYLTENNQYCIAVAPSLIDSYNMKRDAECQDDIAKREQYEQDYYGFYVNYKLLKDGTEIKNGPFINWTTITEDNNPLTVNKYIYLTDDNIITDSLQVFGYSTSASTQFVVYEDFDYTFEHVGYIDEGPKKGTRVDLASQSTYGQNVFYDYVTKISLKNTNRVNTNSDHFLVSYNEEITLDFLYQDAVATSKKYGEPQLTYSVNVLDISSLQNYKNYKPRLGQKVPIYDTEMGFNGFEGFITSVSRVLEKPEDTQIEIATYTSRFEDIFQKLTATMANIQYNENSLYNAANSFEDGILKQSVFLKSLADNKFRVQLGTNNDITIDKETGITLVDIENNNAVKLIGRGIFLTNNYNFNDIINSNWVTGITGDGINANALVSGNIDTKNIQIWNKSENQIRFMWNEEGLVAYSPKEQSGVSTSTQQDFVDYNKYVKFNGQGLNFIDGERSALSLGWDGLKIQAQKDSLEINGDDGLVIYDWRKDKNNKDVKTKRLQLGRLTTENDTNLYGLRLIDTSGSTTFQNDSNGDLWLHRHIRVGGTMDGGTVTNATAGIYGLNENEKVPTEMQMGLVRNEDGIIIWDPTPIRFWAGPQTKESYTTELHITNAELESHKTKFNELVSEVSPSLAKFKVNAKGDIFASGGFNIGGWVAGDNFLRSYNNEAILRSKGYDSGYPVIAVGVNAESKSTTGSDYNFRVFQDGTIKIGGDKFVATSTGAVEVTEININPNNSTTSKLGYFIIKQNGLEFTKTVNKIKYKTGMYAYAGDTDHVFEAGPSGKPNFSVDGKGSVVAKDITLIGNNSDIAPNPDYLIQSTNFTVKQDGTVNISGNSGSINIGNFNTTNFTDDGYTGSLASNSGTIGGLTISSTSLIFTITKTENNVNNTYRTAIYSTTGNDALVFEAGLVKSGDKDKPAPFRVTGKGKLYATEAEITGVIYANTGKIGGDNGFTINTDKIYSGNKSAFTNTSEGLYLGTDGIALGKNFTVSKSGFLTAKLGTIAGWDINSSRIYSSGNGYFVGMNKPTSKDSYVFYAGTKGHADDENEFWVKADGSIKASKLTISSNNVLYNGTTTLADEIKYMYTQISSEGVGVTNIGGYTNTTTGSTPGLDATYGSNYYVGIRAPKDKNNIVFYAGTAGLSQNNMPMEGNNFWVKADGTLKATKGIIGGWSISDSALTKQLGSYDYSSSLVRDYLSTVAGFYTSDNGKPNDRNSIIFVGGLNKQNVAINNENIKYTLFKVSSNGSVFFKGNIYGWSQQKNAFRQGLKSKKVSLYTGYNSTIDVEINNGLIIDIS